MPDSARLRRRLVSDLRRDGFLSDDRVAAAFATVPRHEFVPDQPKKDVYTDRAFITKQVDGVPTSSSSQPSIMALMLEQLDVAPGMRVLEIGAGTGYNAALIANLAGPDGRVVAVDIDPEVAEGARTHLDAAGYNGHIEIVTADGGFGHPPMAPYDRIIATAGCWQIPQPWIEQLAEGGLIVLPFRLNGAHVSLALRKHGDELLSVRAEMCGFMPLRGAFGPTYDIRTRDALISSDVELPPALRKSLPKLLRDGRSVRLPYPRARDESNTPLYFFALQGLPIVRVITRTDSWGPTPFTLIASPRSAIALPWQRPNRGRVDIFGDDAAFEFTRDALARWHADGKPDLRQLRLRVRSSRARLGALPRPSYNGNGYRFRRGEHRYEMWFER
ncbi:MAG: methyltransferase domain-containing protein [Chloroflexi bacterium]|nr:methyltransferase domain-containing protein [Chloroflexota bacterium]